MFLASLASCYALALAHVARKRSIELADVAVRAVGEYDGPKFVKLRVEVTTSHPREELQKFVDKAITWCYVSNTLNSDVKLDYSIDSVSA